MAKTSDLQKALETSALSLWQWIIFSVSLWRQCACSDLAYKEKQSFSNTVQSCLWDTIGSSPYCKLRRHAHWLTLISKIIVEYQLENLVWEQWQLFACMYCTIFPLCPHLWLFGISFDAIVLTLVTMWFSKVKWAVLVSHFIGRAV